MHVSSAVLWLNAAQFADCRHRYLHCWSVSLKGKAAISVAQYRPAGVPFVANVSYERQLAFVPCMTNIAKVKPVTRNWMHIVFIFGPVTNKHIVWVLIKIKVIKPVHVFIFQFKYLNIVNKVLLSKIVSYEHFSPGPGWCCGHQIGLIYFIQYFQLVFLWNGFGRPTRVFHGRFTWYLNVILEFCICMVMTSFAVPMFI